MALQQSRQDYEPERFEQQSLNGHALQQIAEEIDSALSLKELLVYLKDRFLELLHADRIIIYVVDVGNNELLSFVKVGADISEVRVPVTERNVAGLVAKTGRTINIRNTFDDQEVIAIHPQLKIDRSWDAKTGYRAIQMLAVPIRYHRFTLGVVQFINSVGRLCFTTEDEEFAGEISKVLGNALYNQLRKLKRRPTKFDYLLKTQLITQEQLEDAIGHSYRKGETIEEVLIEDFGVRKRDLGLTLSEYYKARFVPFDDSIPIPEDLLRNLKQSYLRSNLWVPLERRNGRITVLMSDPSHLLKRDMACSVLKTNNIEFCVGLKEDILKFLDYFSRSAAEQSSISDILVRLEAEQEAEPEEDLVTETDNVIVQFVNKMIADAYNDRASDIHIEPYAGKRNMQVRFRIDGVCTPYQTVPYAYKRAIVSRLKIMSRLDIAERRLPQDGKILFRKLRGTEVELRVATMPTAGGLEDVVLRILSSGRPIRLDRMGFSKANFRVFKRLITIPYGIILVVGPTGAGKTTTLHSALAYINSPERKIWTAEDPVEITQPGLRQVQVNPKIGLTFAKAMRTFLRCDPDVIMVGEMRDEETAAIGVEASLTGHLVFSTLHTNSAPETVTRLLDMGMDPFNFADALLGILAQRLVRTLCTNCRQPYHPTEEEFFDLGLEYGEDAFQRLGLSYSADLTLNRPKGCEKCNDTGYRGRTGIHELLEGTDEIKRLIQLRRPIDEVRSQAKKDGMITLKQDGIQKVFQGLTHISEVRRVCISR
jgi:type II secretory ATPase GspE/PulE/Tfp pilus assembly ATPase PilB-like protein